MIFGDIKILKTQSIEHCPTELLKMSHCHPLHFQILVKFQLLALKSFKILQKCCFVESLT